MPNETDRDKVIDKVIKLHAHAESAKALGNEEEAEAFAAKVQELLTAYKLSQSDLRDKSKVVEEPINVTTVRFDNRTGSRVAWSEHLAGIVCPAYYCKSFVLTGTNALGVIGQETDRQVCCCMLVTLARLIVIDEVANRSGRRGALPNQLRGHPGGGLVGGGRRSSGGLPLRLGPRGRPRLAGGGLLLGRAWPGGRSDSPGRSGLLRLRRFSGQALLCFLGHRKPH